VAIGQQVVLATASIVDGRGNLTGHAHDYRQTVAGERVR